MQQETPLEVEMTLVRAGGSAPPVDVVVRSPRCGATLHDLRTPLLTALGADPDVDLALGSGTPVPPGAILGLPPLVRGAVLVATESRDRQASGGTCSPARSGQSGWPRPVALLAAHVVSGPDAGNVIPLPPGRHSLGRAAGAAVRVEDESVSREHAELDVTPNGVRVRDLASANGTWTGTHPVGSDWREIQPREPLRLGATTVVVVGPGGSRAQMSAGGDGWIGVERPARPGPRGPLPPNVRLPARPDRAHRPSWSVVPLLVPLLIAVPLALLWSPIALLLALGGPVAAVATLVPERRAAARRNARTRSEYAQQVRAALHRWHSLVASDLDRRFEDHPDPATLLMTACQVGTRLWERRREDTDVLTLRLGAGPRTSAVGLVNGRRDETGGHPPRGRERCHPSAPVVVDIAVAGVLEIAGPGSPALARSLAGQAVALVSPADLAVVVLVASGPGHGGRLVREAHWAWARWLPHALDTRGPGPGPVVAGSPRALRAAVGELLRILDERRASANRADASRTPPRPRWILVVLDGARELRQDPDIARLLREGPSCRLVVLCIEESTSASGVEQRVLLSTRSASGPGHAVLQDGGEDVPFAPDLVGRRWAEQLGRALAPLRDAAPCTDDVALPRDVRLVELLRQATGVVAEDAASIRDGWADAPRCTRALLGVDARGLWEVDLRRDGPHMLVAGTTGAGKSELLASLVLSLTVRNRPEELAVVLVDYKGGATFGPLAALPHAVGLVTDLDDHLARRVLTSLGAEVRRRERLLRDHDCRDLEALLERRAGDPAVPVLPRLLIVVDEFRVLAQELPAFVDGLVHLAGVGRSLGVHLVLATQRPAGVVTAEMRANTNLRVALRVREDLDSVDVVEAPDAARITAATPGRALARTGGGALREVQVARVCGSGRAAAPSPLVRPRTSSTWSTRDGRERGHEGPPDANDAAAGSGVDDLERVVAALTAAATGCPRPASPWTAPLPEVLPRSALGDAEGGRPAEGLHTKRQREEGGLLIGLLDDPGAQRQPRLSWSATAPLLVIGPPRSGRTSTLRALGAAIAGRSPEQWHLVVVRAGGGGPGGEGLEELDGLPHTIAVVDPDDGEHLVRVMRRLVGLITASTGARPAGARTVVLVDGADRLLARAQVAGTGPAAEMASELLLRVLVDGPSAGVVSVLSGDRTLLGGRVGAAVRERLFLSMTDPAEAVMAGIPAASVPTRAGPGRGLLVRDTGVHEVQVVVLDAPPGLDDLQGRDLQGHDLLGHDLQPLDPRPATSAVRVAGQRAALASIVSASERRWSSGGAQDRPGARGVGRAPRVPPLPGLLCPADAERWRPDFIGSAAHSVKLGVGGEEVGLRLLDLLATPLVCVAGPGRSGRTTLLRSIAAQLHRAEIPLRVMTPRRNALTIWAQEAGVALGATPNPGEIVLIDDVEALNSAGAHEGAADALIEHLLRVRERPGSGALVVAGTTGELAASYRGLIPLVRQAGTGVVFAPVAAGETELLGVSVPRGGEGPPGRAHLVRDGAVEAIQLFTT